MSTSVEPRLTFGVEIEFLLATLDEGVEDPHALDPRQVYGIIPPEQGVGWDGHKPSGDMEAYESIAATLNLANIPTSIAHNPLGGQTAHWQVVHEASIDKPADTPYRFISVELRSPPLYFTTQACQQVRAVCEVLTSMYRVLCPESSGLHVHVGNETHGFDGVALQKILATLWTFEPLLDGIHPAHRLDNSYCSSLRGNSSLCHELSGAKVNREAGVRVDAREGLEAILYKSEDPELQVVISDGVLRDWVMGMANARGERGAYNFRNLRRGGDPVKKTIEFRQHEGTLDPGAVEQWIKLCVGIVDFALKVDFEVLSSFLSLHIDDGPEDFDLVRVLKALGLPPQMLFYGAKPLYSHSSSNQME